MSTQNKFTPSDVFYDLLDLGSLLTATLAIVSEMSFANADGSRNEELDLVHGMLRIAIREAKRQTDVASVFDKSSFVFPFPQDDSAEEMEGTR